MAPIIDVTGSALNWTGACMSLSIIENYTEIMWGESNYYKQESVAAFCSFALVNKFLENYFPFCVHTMVRKNLFGKLKICFIFQREKINNILLGWMNFAQKLVKCPFPPTQF